MDLTDYQIPFTDYAPDLTSYRYAFDNPVSFTDPTGLFEEEGGGYGYNDEVGDNPKMINYTYATYDDNKEDDDERYHYVLRPTEDVDELDVSRGTDSNDGGSDELESGENEEEDREDNEDSNSTSIAGVVLTTSQIAFNEIAVPIMLVEPTPFGEIVVGVINMGFTIYNMSREIDENLPSFERMGEIKGKAPRNNQDQNKQFDQLAKQYNLTNKERETLHREISGKGYNYQQIQQEIIKLFKK